MRRKNSLFRIILLAAMLVAVTYLASTSFAQEAGAAAAGGEAHGNNTLMSVILGNKDPVFFTIIILSVVATSLTISSALRLRKASFYPDDTMNEMREMIEARKFKELIDFTEEDNTFVAKALNPALKRAPKFSEMKEAMETAVGEQTAEHFRKIEYLNIIGNMGPLLGLMGTVLGMIDAFNAMNNAGGNADPAVLAGGISKALAHTFLGLFLAVPALAAFGILRTLVDRFTLKAALLSDELLMMIKPQESKPAPGTPARAAGAPTAAPTPARPRVAAPTPPTPAQA